MSEVSDLELQIEALEEEMKTTRKELSRASKAFKKLMKQEPKKRAHVAEMFSGYAEVTPLETQAYQAITDELARASSYETGLAARLRTLEAQLKVLRKELRKAERAHAKAERSEFRAARAAAAPPSQATTDSPARAPAPQAAPESARACSLCGLHPAVAHNLCALCLELAEAERTGDYSRLRPETIRHAVRLGRMRQEKPKTGWEATDEEQAAASVARRFHNAQQVIIDQALVPEGRTPDGAALDDALAPLRPMLTEPSSAAAFLGSFGDDPGSPAPDSFGGLGPFLPKWFTELFTSHEYHPKRHSLTLDDPMNYGSSPAHCDVCGLEGVGAEFYFANDGGVCGTGECTVCGLGEELHAVLDWFR